MGIQPPQDDKYIVDEQVEIVDNSEAISEQEAQMNLAETLPKDMLEGKETANREAQPKLHTNIAFKVIGDQTWRKGKVFAVGRKAGNKKFRCWVKCKKGSENFDFVMDISEWKYCKVEFANASKNYDDSCGIATEILYTGVWFLQHKTDSFNEVGPDSDNLTYVLNIPKKYHDDQEVVESKAKELENGRLTKLLKRLI